MIKSISINGRKIGKKEPPYIVAELSGNHNGKIENAINIIKAAKTYGADAIKLQTYRADTITINHDSPEFIVKDGIWGGRNLFELYKEAHTPWEWHKEIFEYANKLDLTIFSSPFDKTAVDFLEKLNVPAYKIASPELIDLPLIKYVANTGKPIILSTGMANLIEIEEAINTIKLTGNNKIIVLHCTSAYPASLQDANLCTIRTLEKKFNVIIGLSDHTLGTLVSTIAVGLGACMIEKHFTLDRSQGGIDSAFSIEPNELKKLVNDSRDAKLSMGSPALKTLNSENTVFLARRSLYVVKPIKKNEIFTENNIKSIRPGNGLLPKYLDEILGKKAIRNLKFGEPLSLDMIAGE